MKTFGEEPILVFFLLGLGVLFAIGILAVAFVSFKDRPKDKAVAPSSPQSLDRS
jgi:ABC-type transporter Mla subunit MlaD